MNGDKCMQTCELYQAYKCHIQGWSDPGAGAIVENWMRTYDGIYDQKADCCLDYEEFFKLANNEDFDWAENLLDD